MSKHTTKPSASPALTRENLAHLVGNLNDAVMMAILRTGATYQDIEEAVEWTAGDAEALRRERRRLSPAAEAVYEILMSDPGFLSSEREP
jgi:hypothetical protein